MYNKYLAYASFFSFSTIHSQFSIQKVCIDQKNVVTLQSKINNAMQEASNLINNNSCVINQKQKVIDFCNKLNVLPIDERKKIIDEEYEDAIRICDACGKAMCEGYCIDDGLEHYCSDECLHTVYSEETYLTMSQEGMGTSYYTTWWENYQD